MKKRFAALLLAMVTVLSLSACGGGSKAEPETLAEYTMPSHKTYDMPERIETVEDLRTAWKHAISRALEGGGTYNGEPLAAMTPTYLGKKLADAGYPVFYKPSGAVATDSPGNQYRSCSINAGTYLDEKLIYEVGLHFYGVDESDFSWADLKTVTDELKLGAFSEIAGLPALELMQYLGISEEMLDLVLASEDGYLSWYELNGDDSQYWYVSFSVEEKVPGKRTISLSLARIENGHDQDIFFWGSPQAIAAVTYKEHFQSDENKEFYVQNAKEAIAEEPICGHWDATYVETADGNMDLPLGVAYFDFGKSNKGSINVPGSTDGETDIRWDFVRTEETESGQQNLFEIKVRFSDGTESLLTLIYNLADGSAVLTDPDNTFKFVLVKTA